MIKKIFKKIIPFYLLIILILCTACVVNAELFIRPETSYDASGQWVNDANAYDSSETTYAYESVANDNYLECYYTSNQALFSDSVTFKADWYLIPSPRSADNVDVDIRIANGLTSWCWKNIATDVTIDTWETFNIGTVEYVSGVRFRSYDSGGRYMFRVFDVRINHYQTAIGMGTGYYPSTNFFNIATTNWFNATNDCDYSNTTAKYFLNFSADWEKQFNYWKNYTLIGTNVMTNYCGSGDCCGDFSGYAYFNFSDKNLSLNLTDFYQFDSDNCTVIHDFTLAKSQVNETNWLSLLMGSISFESTQFGIIIQLIIFFLMLYMSYKTPELECQNKKAFFHVIPYIKGLYMIFAGINFLSMTYSLSSYVGVIVTSNLTWIGVLICVLGVIKGFYYS